MAIVASQTPVTLIGGSGCRMEDLEDVLMIAPTLVAADGGGAAALAMGHDPVAVIGDLDSLSGNARAQIPTDRIHPVADQDSTDFDKALRNISAPFVIGVGFTGGRIDHELAVFSVLVQRAAMPVILLGAEDVILRAPDAITLTLPVGTRFSVFPMSEVAARSVGLNWPLDGLTLSPGGMVGTSNITTAPTVRVEVERGQALLILPREHLNAVLAAL